MDTNLSLYKIFLTTADCGNITNAAGKLFISQPAVSKAISKLEQNLNTTLFIRSNKGVKLTGEGEVLYSNIKSAFSYIETAEEQITQIVRDGYGQLRIGASTTLCKHVLIPYIKEFKQKYPHISIILKCQSSFDIIEMLERGEIDIGLIGRSNDDDYLNENTIYKEIMEIEDIFVADKSYLRTLEKGATLYDATLLMLDGNNLTRRYVDRYLYQNRIKTGKLMEATSMDLLVDFAKIGLGIACVIKQFVTEELNTGQLKAVSLNLHIPKRSVGFIYSAEALPSEAAKRFIGTFKL